MPSSLQELDYQQTPLGELILRRRTSLTLQGQLVYEVKLNGEFLMSSVNNQAEIALATLGLDALTPNHPRATGRVLVGGLGLGHTAHAALKHPHTQHLDVIELLQPVIDWHNNHLVPLGQTLAQDPHCNLIQQDFFNLFTPDASDSPAADPPYDAILLDIDHSPDSWLHRSHAAFYTPAGLAQLKARLSPAGVFAIWSADPPSPDFLAAFDTAFARTRTHAIEFYNPLLNEEDQNTIILAINDDAG